MEKDFCLKKYIMTLCLKKQDPIYIENMVYGCHNNDIKYDYSTIINTNDFNKLFDDKVIHILNRKFCFLDYEKKFLSNKLICREPIKRKRITKKNFLYLSLIIKPEEIDNKEIKELSNYNN